MKILSVNYKNIIQALPFETTNMLSVRRFLQGGKSRFQMYTPIKSATSTLRLYSSATMKSRKGNEPPSFKKIFLVGIIGTAIFVQAVNSLDKNKPKTTYSEQEFDDVMSGLRRRLVIFPAGQLDVKFVLSNGKSVSQKFLPENYVSIEPFEVVEHFRNSADDHYEALLNDLYNKYGKDTYVENLPTGMLVMLLGKYMQMKCHPGDQVVINNFPHTINDAIKFENEVSVVTKILVPKESIGTDVSKYYQTVKKVQEY